MYLITLIAHARVGLEAPEAKTNLRHPFRYSYMDALARKPRWNLRCKANPGLRFADSFGDVLDYRHSPFPESQIKGLKNFWSFIRDSFKERDVRIISSPAFICQRPQVLNVKSGSYEHRGTETSKLSLLKDEVFEVGRTCMTDDDVVKHGEFCALNLFRLKIDDYRNGSCISALKNTRTRCIFKKENSHRI